MSSLSQILITPAPMTSDQTCEGLCTSVLHFSPFLCLSVWTCLSDAFYLSMSVSPSVFPVSLLFCYSLISHVLFEPNPKFFSESIITTWFFRFSHQLHSDSWREQWWSGWCEQSKIPSEILIFLANLVLIPSTLESYLWDKELWMLCDI